MVIEIIKNCGKGWPIGQIYVTSANLAERYEVSLPTVARWVELGILPPAMEEPHGPKRWRISELIILEGNYVTAHNLSTGNQ